MNRVIKFRGKVRIINEWKYGSLLTYADGECNIITETGHRIDTWNVDPETVGQFTGLKDRNNKEIYEGDILRHTDDNLTAPVEWIGDCFQLGIDDNRYIGTPLYLLAPEVYMDAIGNIHDNHDLLKGDTR